MLNLLIIAIVCFLASTLGPLCGIGGGVIIKPIVDSLGVMGMATTSFLSSLTVLTMSLSTLAQQGWGHMRHPEKASEPYPPTAIPLSIGAAAGGVAGKIAFNAIRSSLGSAETIGAVQAAVLFVLAAATIVYTLLRSRIRTLHVNGAAPSALIGVVTGALWAFLGIGGGPFNLVILTLFFSEGTRAAARESILIIAFSQVASLMPKSASLSEQVAPFSGNADSSSDWMKRLWFANYVENTPFPFRMWRRASPTAGRTSCTRSPSSWSCCCACVTSSCCSSRARAASRRTPRATALHATPHPAVLPTPPDRRVTKTIRSRCGNVGIST